MSGEWLKMRFNLPDEPEVIAMARQLKCDEFCIVGRLHTFWSWAEQCTVDGTAPLVDGNWIDRKVQMAGFAQALCDVGWLELGEDGISVPGFDYHMGQVGKQRALSANRKRNQRLRLKRESRECHDGGVTDACLDQDQERFLPSFHWESLDSLDPKKIFDLAKHYSKTVKTASTTRVKDDRKLLAKVAMLQLVGFFSEAEIESILEQIRQRDPKRKAPYFARCITTLLKQRDIDWHAIDNRVHPPAEVLNGKPECQDGSTGSS